MISNENMVIGVLLTYPERYDSIPLVPIDAFQVAENKIVVAAIKRLHQNQKPVDVLTVAHDLIERGEIENIGGVFALTDYSNNVGSDAHFNIWLDQLIDLNVNRQISNLFSNVMADISSGQIAGEKAINALKKGIELIEVENYSAQSEIKMLPEVVTEAFEDITNKQRIRETTGKELFGVDTGIPELNARHGGWNAPDLIVIAARPGQGKTALMLHLAQAASKEKPCMIYSLEMSARQLATRLISAETQIEYNRLLSGDVSKNDIHIMGGKLDSLMSAKIVIDDTAGMMIETMIRNTKQIKKKIGLSCVFIDYLQLIRCMPNNKTYNRNQEVGYISRSLKLMAKELEIPVIALAQLNRANETRSNKRPILSDLRDSGEIEQDADSIIFLHRPEYYGEVADENGYSLVGLMEINTSKLRNGEAGTDKIRAELKYNRFSQWQEVRGEIMPKPITSHKKMFNDDFDKF